MGNTVLEPSMRTTGASLPVLAAGASPDSPDDSFLPQPVRDRASAMGVIRAMVARRHAFTKNLAGASVEDRQVCDIRGSQSSSAPKHFLCGGRCVHKRAFRARGEVTRGDHAAS